MKRGALLALLLLALLGADLPDVHTHDGSTPGVYNEECPLARLALPAWALPATAPENLAQPGPVPDPAVTVALFAPAPPLRAAFAPRAPPATS
jgi:hypothetical protein